MPQPIKILVVDDLAEKILVYTSLLEEPDREIVVARSGPEALKAVLQHEFAVILLDVNMPGMDGFETAGLIRARKRSAHTPIIFVTAHSDEMHAIRGYAQGAVDFILAPVVPEVLRTKVGVFVELFRLNQQVVEQAEQRVARAEQEREHLSTMLERASDFVAQVSPEGEVLRINRAGRAMLGFDEENTPRLLSDLLAPTAAAVLRDHWLPTAQREGFWLGDTAMLARNGTEVPVFQMIVSRQSPGGGLDHYSVVARDISAKLRAENAIAESERRYRHLVQSLPGAVYTCDLNGYITLYNQAAVSLWGREPELGKDKRCGSWRMYNPDGSPLAPESCPMAVALKQGRPIRGQEIIIERPDGTRSNVLPHPEPIFDASGVVIGAINMLVDITDRKRAEHVRALLAAIVDSTDDAVISKTPEGVITACNKAAERLFEHSADELIGRPIMVLVPPERRQEEIRILERLRAGEHIQNFETVRLGKNGRRIDVSLTVSPLRNASGVVTGASSIARDITARKIAEQELERHRLHLEDLVRERTAELESTHQRLRLADRLASIGTLAAGLGHDMGNLLLPLRMRLDVLEDMNLPSAAKDDLKAISSACEYLRRLSRGLRLLALNPEDARASGTHTQLAAWWEEIAPLLPNALPEGIELVHFIPHDLPPLAMSPHVLTQVVYNLVQNAGDAMRGRDSGTVTIRAVFDRASGRIALTVSDDGPGMDEETRRRCIEPYFSTKPRGISTGLGLVLVCGALRDAGGTIDIDSVIGKGTTVRVLIPTSEVGKPRSRPPIADAVCVDLKDTRMQAYVVSLLRAAGVQLVTDSWPVTGAARIAVLDNPGDRAAEIEDFLRRDPARRAIVFGEPESNGNGNGNGHSRGRATYIEGKPSAARIRAALLDALSAPEPAFVSANH